ncbi:hypothetical protein AB1Y20_012171 [Prymnesium parvum]|uniref:FHA domain-containing protein n=1 Tax=Prymnesium parvum TaxID=97485 RepID=A0AB34IR15_PRYPA
MASRHKRALPPEARLGAPPAPPARLRKHAPPRPLLALLSSGGLPLPPPASPAHETFPSPPAAEPVGTHPAEASPLELTTSPFVVGRARDCDGVVSCLQVSRRHAVFAWSDGAWRVEDISTNGTFVGEGATERLLPAAPRALRSGETLTLGRHSASERVAFRFVSAGAPPSRARPPLAPIPPPLTPTPPREEERGRRGSPVAHEAGDTGGKGEESSEEEEESEESEEDEALRAYFTCGGEARSPPPAPPPPADTTTERAAAAASAASPPAAPREQAGGVSPLNLCGFSCRPRDLREPRPSKCAQWLEAGGELASRFGAPPFSVLDARKGYWRKRRKYWERTYGMRSELGRGDNLLGFKGLGGDGARGTSVFCPVLTEMMYRWFCPSGGTVLDPFAGGCVRGCVAARLGLAYVGVDLSEAQLEENRRQAESMRAIAASAAAQWTPPLWIASDSRELPRLEGVPRPVDFVFSCPPYFNLEAYSDDPRDLSCVRSYAAFNAAHRDIIRAAVDRLGKNRFCCFVVGEIRDEDGFMCNFVSDTIAAFLDAGVRLYNHAVMMLPLHSLPMRASNVFSAAAKLGMCHQHILVFYKGRNPNRDIRTIGLTNASRPLAWT